MRCQLKSLFVLNVKKNLVFRYTENLSQGRSLNKRRNSGGSGASGRDVMPENPQVVPKLYPEGIFWHLLGCAVGFVNR